MDILQPFPALILGVILVLALGVLAIVSWAAARQRVAGRDLQGAIERLHEDNERLARELRQALQSSASSTRMEADHRLGQLQAAFGAQLAQTTSQHTEQLGLYGHNMQEHLSTLSAVTQRGLEEIRQTLETRLQSLQAGNEARLEQMRATVEEKLQSTLETRLGESFRLVSERLEQVHQGLGEMQSLAAGVGDLKRILGNVKVRGTFGEAQLGMLLEQVLLPDQYATNQATRPGSSERVEFAIRLPGRGGGDTVWLPIDAKFPAEDYERLQAAQELGDAEAVEDAGRALESRIKFEARSIREKYIEPPHTTDFAILFVPSESLFAEILRRPGLVDALNRERRVVVAGPTTLFAMLNTLQMGFRTLAIEQRSAEVWRLLGAVKTEFSRFGDWLTKIREQVRTVSNTLDAADTRTRQMQRALKEVEALPSEQSAQILPAATRQDLVE
ncbi:DNA recombination protein RmuC homolog [Burkholderiales bacterium]|nr:DNA recombination protein RmuC homolog [Burkholderiales bacterium]